MLDQVLRAGAIGEHRRLELSRGVELVVARKEIGLQLPILPLLGHEIPAEDLEPAHPLPNFLPQVGRPVAAGWIHRVAAGAVVSFVEGEEMGFRPGEHGCHGDFAVTDGEVDQRPARPAEQQLRRFLFRLRVAVEAVLVDRVLYALGEIGLELCRGDRDAV